jgi:hypothetical protein
MKDNEIQRIVDIRSFLINRYKNLDGKGNPGTSVMLQRDVAYIIERTVKELESLLSDYVKIEKK